jgi:NADH dehydrogenase
MDLNKIFAGRKVNVVLDTVLEIDFSKHIVVGEKKSYTYDYVVLSAGSRPNYFGISGAEEHCYSLWSYDAAVRLNERIKHVFHQAQKMTDEAERRKLLSFWVVGAGFSGVEMISELAEYIPVLSEKYGINQEEVTLNLVDGLGRVVPNLSEKLSQKAEMKLKKMGIRVLLCKRVEKIEENSIYLKSEDEVTLYDASTVIWTAGTQSEAIAKQASEAFESTRGRIQVDEYLRATSDKKVYVVGDNMYYIPEGQECAVPQMVENCEQSAQIAAHNLSCEILGKGKQKVYKPSFHGVMVSIGSKDGVARADMLGVSFSLSGFFAIAAKHFINIIYFLQVLGWNKVVTYMKDEFFAIRNCRSLVGGHLSNRTPSFLQVPIRVWLGFAWLFAGVNGTEAIFGTTHSSVIGILETTVGILLIAGLFSTLSAFVSLIMFFIIADINVTNLWVVFANLTIMSGAGYVIGADYYIMPVLKKWWKRLPFIKKWYLYVD